MLGIRVVSLNLQGGASRKFSYDDVKKFVNSVDILCLQETWLTERDSLVINGYNMHRSDRKKNKRRHCGSGGVVTVYRQELEKGVQKIESMSNDLMWLLLKKEFFNTERDIYLCNCYIPPSDQYNQ